VIRPASVSPAVRARLVTESPNEVITVNKAKGRWCFRGALTLGLFCLGVTTVSAQVAGRVVNASTETPLSGATVQVWDSYPGGSVLLSGTTNGSGAFALGDPGVGSFDVRVYRSGYYPTVVRDLPNPTDNALIRLTPTAEETDTDPMMFPTDVSGVAAYNGTLLKVGDIIEAIDPDGVSAGVGPAAFNSSTGAYLLHVHGDIPGTPGVDEGAETNDALDFSLNGLPATIDPSPYLWVMGSSTNGLDITVASSIVPGATTTGPSDIVGQAGKTAGMVVALTNSGQTNETFTVWAENDEGWTTTVNSVKGLGVALNTGQSAQLVVEVQIPPATPNMTTEVRLFAEVDGYAPGNCGIFTELEVTTILGIGDDRGGLLPDQFSLAQNYPNPFNPSTTIAYNLNNTGRARLEIINIIGQPIRTLFDEVRFAGIGHAVWDGRNERGEVVPTGIYFYRLTQETDTQIRKMVLLK